METSPSTPRCSDCTPLTPLVVMVLVASATSSALPSRSPRHRAQDEQELDTFQSLVSSRVGRELYSQALYAPVCPEVRSVPRLHLPDDAVQDGEEPIRWMLMPDGRGEAQVAVLHGAHSKIAPLLGDIQFLMFTRENPDTPEGRAMNETYMPTFETFRSERPTVVLVHGFGDSLRESLMIPLLKDAFLARGDYNVLAVDWGRHAASPWYQTAAQSTQVVGAHLATMLDHLSAEQGLRIARSHVVGFSLGAHVAGHTGQRLTSGRLRKITGLDPARVLFEGLGPDQRLDKGDADVVEVVHSSGGYLGFDEPLGHRDFYPNGGEWPQPGCVFDFISVCSHRRAYYYYAEALSDSARFPAYSCPSLEDYRNGQCARASPEAHLGDDSDHCSESSCTQGNFFFETNPTSPFAKEENSVL